MSHCGGTGQTLSLIKIRSKGTRETLRGSLSKQVAVTVAIANPDMPLEGGTAQRRKHEQAEHDQRLKQVLDRLVERKLALNLEKCLFSQSRLQYLSQIIDSEGTRKDPSKVKAIADMAEPQDIASLRRFLGLVNHLMKFCPNLAEKTKPLKCL